jgi:hypothetical protein
MDYIKLARQAAARKAFAEQVIDSTSKTPRTKRQPSSAELEQIYRRYGYHAVFCFHDVLYILPCKKCKRSASDAQSNLDSLIRKCSQV